MKKRQNILNLQLIYK